ncbi:MAG: helix-turn-helix transcriptional regulator [Clostridia bacterium]|nr:helix-turn-helix transcriptional regulator [Clostridia bacterium]
MINRKTYKVEPQIGIKSFYSFFKRYYKNGFHFGGEIHDFWECVYVVDGSIQASGDGKVYDLFAGDIIFHKPLEMHKFSVTYESGATLMIFSYTLSGELAPYFKNKVFSLSNKQQGIIDDLLEFADTKTNIVKDNYEHYLFASKNSPTYLQRVATYIEQLFLSLADDGSTTSSLKTPEAIVFRTASRYMKNNIDSNVSVTDIAKACSISESGLKRIFTKYAGISVHKYFLNLKLSAASKLLQDGKNVTEVTDLLGFSSQSYFSAAFKRETGKPPSKVKKQ